MPSHLIALPLGERRFSFAWRHPDTLPLDYPIRLERWENDAGWMTISEPFTDRSSCEIFVPARRSGPQRYRVCAEGTDQVSNAVEIEPTQAASCVAWSAALPVPAGDVHALALAHIDGDWACLLRFTDAGTIHHAAIDAAGKLRWRIDTHLPAHGGWDGHSHHAPMAAWDLDGDGRDEVIYHCADPDLWSGDKEYDLAKVSGEWLIIADAASGEIKARCAWPAARSRVMLTVGHLDGRERSGQIIVQDETYGGIVLSAIEANGEVRWRIAQGRAGGHNLDVADVDGDGKDEVICGGICYRGDGTRLWQAERFGHTDMNKAVQVDASLPGLQTAILVEGENQGAYLLDQAGKTLWKEDFRHAHFGWVACHDACGEVHFHAAEDGRAEHGARAAGMRVAEHNPVFRPDGSHLMTLTEQQRKALMPVQWSAGPQTVFVDRKQGVVIRLHPDNSQETLAHLPSSIRFDRNLLRADILGDHRENLLVVDTEKNELQVLAEPSVAAERAYSPMTHHRYRHDRSQHGSGYYMYACPAALRDQPA